MVDGKWLLQNLIYEETVKTVEDTKQYIGSSGLTLKARIQGINSLLINTNTDFKLLYLNTFGNEKIKVWILILKGTFKHERKISLVLKMAVLSVTWKKKTKFQNSIKT